MSKRSLTKALFSANNTYPAARRPCTCRTARYTAAHAHMRTLRCPPGACAIFLAALPCCHRSPRARTIANAALFLLYMLDLYKFQHAPRLYCAARCPPFAAHRSSSARRPQSVRRPFATVRCLLTAVYCPLADVRCLHSPSSHACVACCCLPLCARPCPSARRGQAPD